jgi:hypothetical protein
MKKGVVKPKSHETWNNEKKMTNLWNNEKKMTNLWNNETQNNEKRCSKVKEQ